MNQLDPAASALVELGRALLAQGYRFITPTPKTHQLVLDRDRRRARDLRDVFGWNRPFGEDSLPRELLELGRAAGVVVEDAEGLRANVRFSSLGHGLYVHSGFPTLAADSVFFGPDTYRFCKLLARSVPKCFRLVDLGCGGGAGGLSVASSADRVVLSDISPPALRFAAVNASLAGVEVELAESDGLASVGDPIDAIVCNPPYLRDGGGRVYRDGGGEYGEGLGLRFLRESLERLSAGGTLVLYTGAPIVEGQDVFWRAARPLCERPGLRVTYEELDPDVFGEELSGASYRDVDRIAAVGLTVEVLHDAPRP